MNAKLDNIQTQSEASLRLLMYSSMPARESAWSAGFEAAASNLPLEENPFINGEQEHSSWESGWWAGFYGEDLLANELVDELEEYSALEVKMKSNLDNFNNDSVQKQAVKQHPYSKDYLSSEHLKHLPIYTKTNIKKVLIVSSILIAALVSINMLVLD